MKTFNHMMDVAFTIINGDSDPDKLTEAALIEGMERRLRDLKKMPPGEALEAFGHCDTSEEPRKLCFDAPRQGYNAGQGKPRSRFT